ncbi:hypothetical protein LTR08_007148 [Meristemomyces frigidus]|nr:hypothetical protein LTR08_007148 [Meristemomyces frigidus]
MEANDASLKGTLSLEAKLSAVLPKDFSCNVRHIYTPPKPCDPLFSPPPGHEPEKTRLSSHFFAVSANSVQNHGHGNLSSMLGHADIMVLGIEILVYTTRHLTTIFVSKADSTGFMSQNPEAISVKPIVITLMQWMVSQEMRRQPGKTVVISLFARAQSQYLFPGSADNGRKHVLDDRQLIKWWAKVLDPVLADFTPKSNADVEERTAQGYLTVPGFDHSELRQFYPPHRSSEQRTHWTAGNPLRELAATRGVSPDAPPRCLLPRFPDDPKARFMQDLDDEVGLSEGTGTTNSPFKRRTGKWGSIYDLERFWEAMEFRQECSSGRMVGFIWVVVPPTEETADGGRGVEGESQGSSLGAVPNSELAGQRDATPTPVVVVQNSPTKRQRRLPLTGPIIARKPRLKGGSSSTSTGLATMLNNSHNSQDGMMVTSDAYGRAIQTLLHLDFADLNVAGVSTRKWVAEVKGLCGLTSEFAVEVSGTAKVEKLAKSGIADGSGQVKELSGMVRRKRKAGDNVPLADDGSAVSTRADAPAVNVLGEGMVRKKSKPSVD